MTHSNDPRPLVSIRIRFLQTKQATKTMLLIKKVKQKKLTTDRTN